MAITDMVRQLQLAKPRILGLPDGDEIFQEVCLRCLRKCTDRNWEQPQIGFIFHVAHSVRIDRWRFRRTRKEFWQLPGSVDDASVTGQPTEEIEKKEIQAAVRDSLAALPDRYREALRMRFLDGLTVSEIAELTREPLQTVKTRITRGKRLLKEVEHLAAYAEE